MEMNIHKKQEEKERKSLEFAKKLQVNERDTLINHF